MQAITAVLKRVPHAQQGHVLQDIIAVLVESALTRDACFAVTTLQTPFSPRQAAQPTPTTVPGAAARASIRADRRASLAFRARVLSGSIWAHAVTAPMRCA